MFYINQYIKKTDGTTTKAAYERKTLYDAQAEYHRRQGNAMAASDTVSTLCMIIDDNGAVYASEKAVKPVEPTEPTTEA